MAPFDFAQGRLLKPCPSRILPSFAWFGLVELVFPREHYGY
jgi:hypothetical protein